MGKQTESNNRYRSRSTALRNFRYIAMAALVIGPALALLPLLIALAIIPCLIYLFFVRTWIGDVVVGAAFIGISVWASILWFTGENDDTGLLAFVWVAAVFGATAVAGVVALIESLLFARKNN